MDVSHPPLFAASGDAYFLLLPVEDGIRGAFKQVVMVNASVRRHQELKDRAHGLTACMWLGGYVDGWIDMD